jgi:anti-anti-sigma factor
LLRLFATTILPYAFWLTINGRRLLTGNKGNIHLESEGNSCCLRIAGDILDPVHPEIRSLMRQISEQNTNVVLDLTDAEYLSPGYFGLLLLLKKHLDNNGVQLTIVGVTTRMHKLFRWNSLLYLIM